MFAAGALESGTNSRDVHGSSCRAGGAGQQRCVKHEVDVVDQRYPDARRRQTLEFLRGVVAAEAPTRDDNVLTYGA